MIEDRNLSARNLTTLDGSFTHTIAECWIPDAMMFGYPTRLVDSWTPSPERIMLPGLSIAERQVNFGIGKGVAYRSFGGGQLSDHSLKAKIRERLARWIPLHRAGEESIVFDSRPLYEGNLAHLCYSIIPHILVCRTQIRERTGLDLPVTVVFRKNAHPLARKFMDYLQIPAIYTDAQVQGTLVEFGRNSTYSSMVMYDQRLFDFPIKDYQSSTPEKIFISRRGVRNLINDEEVSDYLQSRGFERFLFEDLSLSMQVSLMRNAREVVAIHGAALGGLVFNRIGAGPGARPGDGVRLVELFGAGYIVGPYRHLAASYNGSWAAVRGQVTSQIVRDLDELVKPRSHANSPFRIHIGSLEEALNHVSKSNA